MFHQQHTQMTVENHLSYPLAGPVSPQQMAIYDSSMSLPLTAPTRTRNHSGGSTGSYGSTGSSSSGYNSDRTMPPLSPELMYQLTRMQTMARVTQQQQQQQQQRPRRVDRPASCVGERTVAQSQVKNVNPTRYKTEMCRPFEESGYCKYGEKCQFAHGVQEQRSLSRHPKYKTDLCRTFHTTGYCPYGPRCHFIHNEDELKLHEITHMKQQQVLKQVAEQVAQQQVMSRLNTQVPKSPQESQLPLVVSQPPHPMITRPQTLDFSSLPLPMSLGSTIDTPPSSVTDSPPSLSPISMMGDDVFNQIPTPPPGFTAPPALSNVFNFQDLPRPAAVPQAPNAPLVKPCALSAKSSRPVSTWSSSPLNINVANLAAGLQAVSLQTTNSGATDVLKEYLSDLFSTPTATQMPANEPTFESPLGNERLPIFSRMAVGSN